MSESTKDYVAMATPLFLPILWDGRQIESMDVFSSTSSRESPMLLRRPCAKAAVAVQTVRYTEGLTFIIIAVESIVRFCVTNIVLHLWSFRLARNSTNVYISRFTVHYVLCR